MPSQELTKKKKREASIFVYFCCPILLHARHTDPRYRDSLLNSQSVCVYLCVCVCVCVSTAFLLGPFVTHLAWVTPLQLHTFEAIRGWKKPCDGWLEQMFWDAETSGGVVSCEADGGSESKNTVRCKQGGHTATTGDPALDLCVCVCLRLCVCVCVGRERRR